jgi:hypothetical protein
VRRAALAAILGTVMLAAAPAAHGGVIEPADQAELANTLAEAQEEQDVCYGWNVSNNFDSSPDIGSSVGGPGAVPLIGIGCQRYMFLYGSIDYACGSCDASDTASVRIFSNLPDAPTADDLEDLGLEAGDLTGDRDDITLINMVGALPLLAAQTGAVAPVAHETPAAVPATDVATDHPGSDFMRTSWFWLLLFGFLAVLGPAYWLRERSVIRRREAYAIKRQEALERIREVEARQAPSSAPPPPPPAPPQT